MINEFVIEAMRCNGLAAAEKSSVGVIAGGKIELPSGLGAADDAVVVGVVPGSVLARTILNADSELRTSSPSFSSEPECCPFNLCDDLFDCACACA